MQEVHSFDLVSTAPGVVACNMAAVPLDDASVDAAIFCLALMGTDYGSFLQVKHTFLQVKDASRKQDHARKHNSAGLEAIRRDPRSRQACQHRRMSGAARQQATASVCERT